MKHHVLYRGPLSSCNYGCAYCPFAKRAETYAALAGDREGLDRFLMWLTRQTQHRFSVLFTPWGEALIRPWYQQALIALTRLQHVERAAIQTNLSCDLAWVEECDKERLALWTTYHPSEVSRERFLAKVRFLHERGVRFSVGVVGLLDNFPEIAKLREELPPGVYLWVNAYKRALNYYDSNQVRQLIAIDPLFPVNDQHHVSLGQPCYAGEMAFTVDGEGTMRRCHFVGQPIGSIHAPDWEAALRPRPCPKHSCGCYIGYIHLKRLNQEVVYGADLLARIPVLPVDGPSAAIEIKSVSESF